MDTLGIIFNEITDLGLAKLLTQARALVSLELEDNAVEFDPTSQGVDRLWGEESRLRHLNMLCNSLTIQSFINFLWKDGRSQLETLDAVTPTHDRVWVPVQLLLFVLANRSMQRLHVWGTRFCAGGG